MTAEQTALRGQLDRARIALYVAYVGDAPASVTRALQARVDRLRVACGLTTEVPRG